MQRVATALFCAGAALVGDRAAPAQQLVSIDKLPPQVQALNDARPHEPLPCSVHPVKPALNFGFRFQTGYTVETSLDPYVGGRHHWYIVFRVTPKSTLGQDSGSPVYFLDSLDVPPPRETGFLAENTGAFQTGEGRYDVKWALLDDMGRFCRQEWTVDAHLPASERSEKVAMPSGTVGDFSWRPVAPAIPAARSRRITILLNATLPLRPKLGPPVDQWGMLLSMLESLVEQMPRASVRVVAFDTAQQRELFRKDDFASGDMNEVARIENAPERWAVDYQVLQNPSGGWDLLRDLANREAHAPSPPDSVVFLGVPSAVDPRSRKMPPGMPGPQSAPRFFYLKYGPATRMPLSEMNMGRGGGGGGPGGGGGRSIGILPAPQGGADQQDLIEQAIRHMKGKTIAIPSPASFSNAIETIKLAAGH